MVECVVKNIKLLIVSYFIFAPAQLYFQTELVTLKRLHLRRYRENTLFFVFNTQLKLKNCVLHDE